MRQHQGQEPPIPSWQQMPLLPVSHAAIFCRVELDGPTGRAQVSITTYSGENLEVLETLTTIGTSMLDALTVAHMDLAEEVNRWLGDLSPF